jgi:hypothetical protein
MMRRKNEKAAPKIILVMLLLKKNDSINPDMAAIIRIMHECKPGCIYVPEIMPKHNGRQIRRNGISLVSTVCSG